MDPDDILSNLLNQPPYVRQANTEDFLEKLHSSTSDDQKEFRDKFNQAVKSNLKFNVTISKQVTSDNVDMTAKK